MNFFKKIIRTNLPFALASPALIWQFIFLYLPVFVLVGYSFLDLNAIHTYFSISAYHRVLGSVYLKVILNSFFLAFITSIICALIAYPVAYFFSMKVRRFRTALLFSLILPSWTSFIVQIYAWFFLLKKGGLISFVLRKLGLISEFTHLLNNQFAVTVGMAYCYLPFMILPIYAVMEKMDKRLIEASSDLGANWIQTFRKIIFPISFPGVLAGFFLVFIPSFGEFAVPDLLGGGRKMFWGSVVVEKFLITRDWQSGSAFAFLGIISLALFFCFVYIFISLIKRQKSKKFL